jgi:hypothetical protein
MANRFGIPGDIEQRLRRRDNRCVYCGKEFSHGSRRDMPTIEHLNENPPFYWRQGLKEDGLAICCGSCNCSRGRKSLQVPRRRQSPEGCPGCSSGSRRWFEGGADARANRSERQADLSSRCREGGSEPSEPRAQPPDDPPLRFVAPWPWSSESSLDRKRVSVPSSQISQRAALRGCRRAVGPLDWTS